MTSAETQAPQAAAVVWKFPLTVAGTTFAFGVAASARHPVLRRGAAVHRRRRLRGGHRHHAVPGRSRPAAHLDARCDALDRLAGILLTAIAVILLANGFTNLVLNRLHR